MTEHKPIEQHLTGYRGHTTSGPTVPQSIRNQIGRDAIGCTFIHTSGEETQYTYKEVDREMSRRGQALLDAGLKKGDRAAFVLPESEDFVLTFVGALAVGVVPVPMYPPLSFGKLDAYIDTAARIINKAEATVLITDKRVRAVLGSLLDRCPTLERILTAEEDLNDAPFKGDVDIDHIELTDPVFLQFTSGSTSDPKGVVVTHGSLVANLFGIMHVGLEVVDEDVAVSWLPLYHDMGLIGFVLCPLWWGINTVFIPTLSFIKHPTIWMETVSRHHGSITFAPNFAFALATRRTRDKHLEKLDLSRLKALGCGAEPNHPETLRAFIKHFEPAGLKKEAILPVYGMAEATLAMTFCKLADPLRTDVIDADAYHDHGLALSPTADSRGTLEYVSCGEAFPYHEIEIVDEAGNPVPDRTVGEIIFRGPSVTAGYFKDEGAGVGTYNGIGLHTGDLGYVADGELFVTGRRKDIVILNGRNYDPQTIEWVAAEVEGIRKGNVVAFGRPGATTEELIIVAETRSDEDAILTREVKQRVRDELFLNAAEVKLVGPGQLPKTSSGKLQRRKTRQQYLDGELGGDGVRTLGEKGQMVVLAKHVARSMVTRVRHNVKNRARRYSNILRRTTSTT